MHTIDEDTLSFPPALLPQLPLIPHDDWNVAYIVRDPVTKELTATFTQRVLDGVNNIWHSKSADCLALTRIQQFAQIVSLVSYSPSPSSNPVQAVAKIARFEFEIPRITQETASYKLVCKANIAPAFLGHVTEDGRVIGFLLEKVEGRAAALKDLEACQSVLKRLHNLDLCTEMLIGIISLWARSVSGFWISSTASRRLIRELCRKS